MNPYSLDHIMVKLLLMFMFFVIPQHSLLRTRRTLLASLFDNTFFDSVLSRSPSLMYVKEHFRAIPHRGTFRLHLEIEGFEPSTYGLQSRRSSQLSYIPSYDHSDYMIKDERSRTRTRARLPF